MGFLIDTNVLSELRKRGRSDPQVRAWATRTRTDDIFLSVLVVGEIRHGIERIRGRDPAQAATLDAWLTSIVDTFGERILPVTGAIAESWGRLSTPDRLPIVDGLLAATAIVHGHVLVTRNTRDVARTGVPLLNPFEPLPMP